MSIMSSACLRTNVHFDLKCVSISAIDSCCTRDGDPNNVQCGGSDVVVKNSSSGYNRITYLKFALSSLQGLKRKKDKSVIMIKY